MQDRPMQTVKVRDLGRMPYQQAWDLQTQVHEAVKAGKRSQPAPLSGPEHQLLFVEHDPVYTLGKSGKIDHLLLSEAECNARKVEFHRINRGGDITYHGPGQIVGYPILDLDWFFNDVRRYVWSLEESVIRTLAHYNIVAERYPGYTGVWLLPDQGEPWRKICAIGVHLSRWVTLHGFAFNVNTDLSYFRNIVPCGITPGTHEVTSMASELGADLDLATVKSQLAEEFSAVFNCELLSQKDDSKERA